MIKKFKKKNKHETSFKPMLDWANNLLLVLLDFEKEAESFNVTMYYFILIPKSLSFSDISHSEFNCLESGLWISLSYLILPT